MRNRLTPRQALGLGLALAALAGCSKEKAVALKTAAEAARTHAVAGLAGARTLIERSLEPPAETQEERIGRAARDFAATSELTAEKLNLSMTDEEVGERTWRGLDDEFSQLERKYLGFAAMFRSLPDGSYLSAGAVRKAEGHAIHLAADFMRFARSVEKLPGVFNAERAVLVAAVNRAKKLPPAARDELLRSHAAAALQLRQRERAAKTAAIVECLRAAEAFRTTAELIRGYGKLSVGDMLVTVRELLTVASDISGQQADVAGLLEHYGAVESRIRSDPYWQAALAVALQP